MIDQRLLLLRKLMSQKGIDACIFPTNDPHFSEYPPDHWKTREWISGFTGSAGTVVVTQNHAGLWTDSRYFLVAENEFSNNSFELHKVTDRSQPGFLEYLVNNLNDNDTVSINSEVLSLNGFERMRSIFKPKKLNIHLDQSFINEVWTDRPQFPTEEIFIHDLEFAGVSRIDKINEIRNQMTALNTSTYLVTALDEIAWTLNLRGADTENNPVFVSYLIIERDKVSLFINPAKVPENIKNELLQDNIHVYDYESVFNHLQNFEDGTRLLADNTLLNMKLVNAATSLELVDQNSIIQSLKAIKNPVEIKHFRNAMIKDGVALTQAFKWLEDTLKTRTISEYEFGKKLTKYREQQANFKGESFSPIVGFNGNGAIIHYRAPEIGSNEIKRDGVLLVDSGAQFVDGTTDITRTIATGQVDKETIHLNTLVLKGHIALSKARFPEGTRGAHLDVYARQFLWNEGHNFSHGTGHGVGFFLNVHEGPQGISPAINSLGGKTIFKAGMVSSNEPGYYKEGAFGIRIENLICCQKAKKEGFLEFETITYFPYDSQLIDSNLLSNEEKSWLNAYHEKVYELLSPHLDQNHSDWLREKCVNF